MHVPSIRQVPKMLPASPWRFILHGGCTERCPDVEVQQKIREHLHTIGSSLAASLERGTQAKDAAAQAISALEDCPLYNAGHGAALNWKGYHELDAGLVDGHSGAYGAVSCTRTTRNPILVAKALLENGPHPMLVGQAADDMAKKLGFDPVTNETFTTPARRIHMESVSERGDNTNELDTVGVVVRDINGHFAAGGSTGGVTGKREGRVSDTAILGAGIFADAEVAVACSGFGDDILRHLVASMVAHGRTHGRDLQMSARQAVLGLPATGSACSVAAIDAKGCSTMFSTARCFHTVSASAIESLGCQISPSSCPILPQHEIYRSSQFSAGLSRYPSTPGHTLIDLEPAGVDVFDLLSADFVEILTVVSELVVSLQKHWDVKRCGLVTDGGRTLSVLPLHGLNDSWAPVTSQLKEFHEFYPGYVSSKDGPKMDDLRLDVICAQLQAVSGISKPFNYGYKGEVTDENLFAKIVRGDLPQWRIWEDDDHVAFLTPFANTPGFTVLVPRRHLTSDIFAMDNDSLRALLNAAHKVAGFLKSAFQIRRCGMIFEGFEIDYAHIKLIPIIDDALMIGGSSVEPVTCKASGFHRKYQGFVSSLDGPKVGNLGLLETATTAIREMIKDSAAHATNPIKPPRTWTSPPHHLSAILHHPWYEKLFQAQNALFHASVDFFRTNLGYRYGFVPLTTDSVSSPMGLGSDSLPVSISLFDRDTYLADSMQFALECLLRIQSDVPGVYYVGTSFRGEDPDYMHLNQFNHIECELRGNLDSGIEVAEGFIVHLVSSFLQEQRELIRSVIGNVDHLTALLEQKRSCGGTFPRISVDSALALPYMDSGCWEYVTSDTTVRARALTRKGELALIQHYGGGAVWLTELDHLSVPFYQAFADDAHQKARCADLLLGNGEVLGLGERHATAEDAHAALVMHDVSPEKYAWYLQMRRECKLTTTGWGIGIERFLAWMFQHDDIRDMALLPRMKGITLEP